jgi:hypothetical protein
MLGHSHIRVNIFVLFSIYTKPLYCQNVWRKIKLQLRPLLAERDWIVASSMALLRSKYELTYERLLSVGTRTPQVLFSVNLMWCLSPQGSEPSQISPQITTDQFWADLLALDVDSTWLSAQLRGLSGASCLGPQKASILGL